MKTSVGKTKLELASGDITKYEVDAVVTPAKRELWMGPGVAAAIKRAGGEAVEEEAMLQGPIAARRGRRHHRPRARGPVGHPRRGHRRGAAGTRGRHRQGHPRHPGRGGALHARSLAMPAYGTGGGGFPLYQCASIMIAETVAYLKERKNTRLRHVMVCVYNEAAKAAFTNAMVGIGRL